MATLGRVVGTARDILRWGGGVCAALGVDVDADPGDYLQSRAFVKARLAETRRRIADRESTREEAHHE